jgi:hypothetical protein cdiviTM7_00647
MKNFVKTALLAAVTVFAVGATTFATPAHAADCKVTGGLKAADSCAKGVQEENGGPTSLFDGDSPIFTTAINIMLFIIGILSVIMLIYGGIRYVLSSGDSGAVTNAKNTIMYAIIGLVIAILAYAIVNFVIGSITNKN